MSRGCDTSSTSGSARESTNRVRDAAESAACSANHISRTARDASHGIGHSFSQSANRVCGARGRVTIAGETSSEATNGISLSSEGVSRHQLTLLHLITLREATRQCASSTCRRAGGVASSAWYCSCGSIGRAGAARDTLCETANRVCHVTDSATRVWEITSGTLKRARRSSSESGRRVGYSTRGAFNCVSRISRIHRGRVLVLLPKTSQEAAEQAGEDVQLALVQSTGKPPSESASSIGQAARRFSGTASGVCNSLTAFREAREEENVGEIVEFALLNLVKGVVLVHGSSEEVDLVGLNIALLLLLLAIRGGLHSRGGHGTAGEGGGYNAELHCC